MIVKTSTLLRLQWALVKRKYRLLYSSRRCGRPGPKGPPRELIDAVVQMKRRNPYIGCRKIAEQISNAFGLEINKDVVRRILIRYYRPGPNGDGGPSWIAAIARSKDRLWSIDLFRAESILLKSYWVMVVMDVFSRRIIGFGVAAANLDGIRVCRNSGSLSVERFLGRVCGANAWLNIRHTRLPSRLAAANAEADDPTGVNIHHHQDPITPEQNRLSAEEIDTPPPVFRWRNGGQPRRAIAARRRPIIADQNPPHDILVDVDAECACDLLGNLAAIEMRVTQFHLYNCVDQFPCRTLGA